MTSLEQLAALPAQLQELSQRMLQMEWRLLAYVESVNDEVDTHEALKITGIKSRDTLIKERDRPGSLIKYSKHGRSVSYSRKSCIDYKLSRRLNQYSPAPMRLIS
ncbi:hypothetical protein [Hymenobacter sp. YC55]|uniref:hypothetical protein n=1 Tax=Hymenobacter sp. YC55 TaxID=3034019 RepID=UPI0023F9E1F0|nr:hypothetical protein [Hymenobacter sp. YC55]MDF7813637.1 hypothetical protein [Hymenobacter sp. YC55]